MAKSPSRLALSKRERLILCRALIEIRDWLPDINDELTDDETPPITNAEIQALSERLHRIEIPVELGTHEPDHLLGVFNNYCRDLHLPGRYTEFIVPHGGALVFAKCEHPIPSVSWDAYYVTHSLDIFKVAVDVTPFRQEKPDAG